MMKKAMNWSDCLPREAKTRDVKSRETTTPRSLAEFLLDLYTAGWTQQQVLSHYPNITPDIVNKVFRLAALFGFREEVILQLSLSIEIG